MNRVQIGLLLVGLSLGAGALAGQQPGPPNRGRMMMSDTALAQREMRMMDSLNLRLDTLVTRMNKASGKKKVAAMAEVITELVAQRRAMQEHMRQMMRQGRSMMGDMMGESQPVAKPQPTPALRPDSSAADSGHAEHHPPQ
jgi:hypothetical protein